MPPTPPPTMPAETPDRRVALLLRRAWYNLNQAFRRRIAHRGLTPDQFTILRWLAEHPQGTSQRGLADLMSSDANTMTSLLRRMERARLVERSDHPSDRRCHHIRLSARGRRLHAELQPLATALQDEVLAPLPGARRAAFLADLERLSLACERASDACRPAPARKRARTKQDDEDAVEAADD